MLAVFGLAIVVAGSPLVAQDVPTTDVYLVAIEPGEGELPNLGEPRNLTDRQGYDNQPAFLPDGSGILYTSMVPGPEEGTLQTDIVHLDLASGETRWVTRTPDTSEYSPTPIDGGKALSVVRVEPDGKQRLWSFPLDGEDEPELLLPNVEPVGYHAWEGDDELVLFVLGEPHTLQRVQLGGEARVIASNIGRALHRIPGERAAFSFVHKGEPAPAAESDEAAGEDAPAETWWVRRLDVADDRLEPLIETFPGREDLTWDPAGRAWTADGSKLYRWCPACGADWKLVADLGDAGLNDITRLAVSPDGKWLAVVSTR